MKNKWVVIAAIAALTIIEVAAMYFGYDGFVRSIIIAAICGLGGWILPNGKLREVLK